jgi:hypothetical protein
MSDPMDPRELAQLMDDAVTPVRPRPDALATIHRGVRRRRALHRVVAAATVVLAVTAGGAAYGAVQGGGSPQAPLGSTGHQLPTTPTRVPTTTPPISPPPTGMPTTPPTSPPHVGDVSATIAPVGNPRTTEHFLLVVHLAGGRTQSVPFTTNFDAAELPPAGWPLVDGIADAGPNGQPVIFAFTHRIVGSAPLSVFTIVGGRLTQVTMSGQPALVFTGGPIMVGNGFTCNDPGSDLTVTGYKSAGLKAGTNTWIVYRDTYAWSGASLAEVHKQQATIHATLSSPQLTRYASVHCGTVANARP